MELFVNKKYVISSRIKNMRLLVIVDIKIDTITVYFLSCKCSKIKSDKYWCHEMINGLTKIKNFSIC